MIHTAILSAYDDAKSDYSRRHQYFPAALFFDKAGNGLPLVR